MIMLCLLHITITFAYSNGLYYIKLVYRVPRIEILQFEYIILNGNYTSIKCIGVIVYRNLKIRMVSIIIR